RIDHSVAAAPPGSQGGRTLSSVRLAEGLGLTGDGAPPDDARIRLWDERSGWEQVRTAGELRREGLRVSLGPYEARVLAVGPVEPEPAAPAPAAAVQAAGPARPRPPMGQRQVTGSRRRAAQPVRRKTARVSPPRRRPLGARASPARSPRRSRG